MTTSRRRTIGAASALATALLLAPAAAGAASAAPSLPAPPRASTGHNCWYELDTGRGLCVPVGTDLAASVARSFGVRVVAPAGAGDSNPVASRSAAVAAAPAASVVLSQIFDDSGYGGSSYMLSVNNGSCSTSAYGIVDLNPIGWYGRVSSFKSYNGCKTAIFSSTNYGGTAYGYYVNASSVGSMNDRAKSWRVSG